MQAAPLRKSATRALLSQPFRWRFRFFASKVWEREAGADAAHKKTASAKGGEVAASASFDWTGVAAILNQTRQHRVLIHHRSAKSMLH